MRIPPVTNGIDNGWIAMELKHLETNETICSLSAHPDNFEPHIKVEVSNGDTQPHNVFGTNDPEVRRNGSGDFQKINIKLEPNDLDLETYGVPDSSCTSSNAGIASQFMDRHRVKLEHDVKFSPKDPLQSPQKNQVKKTVKVVLWSKKPMQIDENKISDKQLPRKEHLFVVKQSHSDEKKTPKGKQNPRKKGVVAKVRKSSKSLKRKRRNKAVQAAKQKNYRKLLQSYITSQHIADFKVDALFQQEDENQNGVTNPSNSSRGRMRSERGFMAELQSDQSPQEVQTALFDFKNPENAFTVDLENIDDVAHFEQVECPATKKEPKRRVLTPPTPRRSCTSEISFDEQGKPRCTYTELIERALTESGGLTVSEIYQWISDHYPFFRPNDDRWKNSVRHNLSINPYFKKGDKARSGAGHQWTISEESRALRHAIRKRGDESQELTMSIENETDRAVASILGQYNLAKANMAVDSQSIHETESSESETKSGDSDSSMEISPTSSNGDPKGTDATAPILVDYGNTNTEFPGGEFTIQLDGLYVPEAGLDFEDLITSGRLIFIQADDQDSDKENNNNMHCETSGMEQYMPSDFAAMHTESPSQSHATERMSGQLISEALTQEFTSSKPCESVCSTYLADSQNSHDMSYERENLSTSGSQDFMSLESIDPVALQDVMHVANVSNSMEHYHSMNNIGFESRDIGYSPHYDQEIIL